MGGAIVMSARGLRGGGAGEEGRGGVGERVGLKGLDLEGVRPRLDGRPSLVGRKGSGRGVRWGSGSPKGDKGVRDG